MYKVLITGKIHQNGLDIFAKENDIEIDNKPDYPYEQVLEIIGDYDCILSRSETPITKELIEKGKNLKVIARAAVGIENIDVESATQNGILVINTPGQNTNSAAELTIALLLAAIRNVVGAHFKMKDGGWDRHTFTGTELYGKTIGVVGLGNVGHRVAKFAKGFDMKVIGYDPYISDHRFVELGVEKTPFDDLLAQSDIITLHVPKVKETVGMIGSEQFAKMKKGVVIVNAARGGIIKEEALVEALHSGKVAHACLDTFEVEPLVNESLRGLSNVTLTPHIGASTKEAQVRIADTIAVQTIRALRGEIVDSPVNMPKISFMADSPVRAYSVLTEKLGKLAQAICGFNPDTIIFHYRGELAKQENSILKLSFLKGFLQHTTDYPVTYVNAERLADEKGIHLNHLKDEAFGAYNSAIKITLSKPGKSLSLGGIVFDNKFQRITLVDEFYFEVEAEGTLLCIRNEDKPGVVGNVGVCLADFGINIQQMDLSRNRKGGQAMQFISTDSVLDEKVISKLKSLPNILDVITVSF